MENHQQKNDIIKLKKLEAHIFSWNK